MEENILGVILQRQVDVSAVPVVVRAPSEPSVVNRSLADCRSLAAEPSKRFPRLLPPRELVVSLAPPYSARLAPTPACDDAAPPAHDLLAPGYKHHHHYAIFYISSLFYYFMYH